MQTQDRQASVGRIGLPAPSEAGSVLLIALLGTMILSVLALSMAAETSTELEVAANYHAGQAAFYAADGGIQSLFDEIVTMTGALARFPATSELAGVTPPMPPQTQFSSVQGITVGGVTNGAITTGPYQGLIASTQQYDGILTAETTSYPRGEATVAMRAAVDLIPIFQFAAFYERDLELHPGALMNITGRVHTNADMYVTSHNGLYFESNVTAVGTMNWGKKISGALYADDVYYQNASSSYVAMNGLDESDPNWHDESLNRWDGNVRTAAHGVDRLNLTLPDPSHPRGLIEPGLASDDAADAVTKLYYKSNLRILNGIPRDDAGAPVSVVDPISGDTAIRYTVINDARESHPMLVYEIDLSILADTPAWPTNGAIYVASAQPGDGIPSWTSWPAEWSGYTAPYSGGNTEFAIKLINGSELATPLTIVSENPVYVRGNYNVVNKKGAAVIADTVTLLSNNWGRKNAGGSIPSSAPDDDLGYSALSLSNRTAASTTYNLAIMGGNTETTSTEASGGLHNVLRYLERWTGRTSTYRGSIAILWYSQHAYSPWFCCPSSGFYYPPNRNYSFDTDYLDPANLPPNTPSAMQIRVMSWRRE